MVKVVQRFGIINNRLKGWLIHNSSKSGVEEGVIEAHFILFEKHLGGSDEYAFYLIVEAREV